MNAAAAPSARIERRPVIAWALFDFGNSAFATTVMAGFFPIFFKQYWSDSADAGESTLRLGVANSLASIAVAAAAPLLGAIADLGGAKKRLLAFFTLIGAAMTGALAFVARGDWRTASAFYVLATIGFSGGIVFYDALLVSVAPPERRDRVSALGYALGYIGGGLLFLFNIWMTREPGRFGLGDAGEAVRASFVLVAVWWAAFAVPILLWVREPRSERHGVLYAVRAGARQLVATVRRARELRAVWMFLFAYWLYIDGVDTIVRMAVDYGLSLGFPSQSLIVALLITQFVGFPAAIVFGRIGERIGARRGILLGVGMYLLITLWGYAMDSIEEFYALAVAIGLVQGGVQALSRSFYSRLVPPEEAGEFFGFFNMLGKFAAVIGPALMGVVAYFTGSARTSILSIAVLFLAGGALLTRVPEPAPRDAP